jgi:acetolactate synthase-like protein
MEPVASGVRKAASLLGGARKPVLVVGSQVLAIPQDASAIASAIRRMRIPAFLGGTARGLLGKGDPLQLRHKRSQALREADAVIVAGFPLDFRMGYGRKINRDAKLVTVNRDSSWLRRNRRPDLAVHADPGRFLAALARQLQPGSWSSWLEQLRAVDEARSQEIVEQSEVQSGGYVNPLQVAIEVEERLSDESVVVVDGGDFVASCSYVVSPRSPLSWLDPGVYGTLGVGGGFALGAAAVRPRAEVWLLWGDGAAGFSLAEVDTMVRHGMKVIMIVGTDASWGQIARDQVTTLGDAVGTELLRTNYQTVCEGYGGQGILVKEPEELAPALDTARELAEQGPVLVNVWLGKSEFRKGSISL